MVPSPAQLPSANLCGYISRHCRWKNCHGVVRCECITGYGAAPPLTVEWAPATSVLLPAQFSEQANVIKRSVDDFNGDPGVASMHDS